MPVPPDPDLSQLRVIVARARVQRGLTIEQLAEASGVSRQTILNLGSGKHHGDLKTWLKLSKALEVSLDELLAPVWAGGVADSAENTRKYGG